MRLSTIARVVVRKVPVLPALLVHLWAESYILKPRLPHRFFSALKWHLDYRLTKKVRLVTGQQLYVDPFDSVGRELWQYDCYEPDTVALFHAILSPGMVVVDAGAHIGYHSLVASRLVENKGQVHAFEPDPDTFKQLRRNVILNQYRNRAALSHETGVATLHLAGASNIGGNSLRRTIQSRGRQIEVPVETLDEYAVSRRLAGIDLLKADVEGAELRVLQGGAKVVNRFRPAMIIEFSIHYESFGYSEKDVRRRLAEWG